MTHRMDLPGKSKPARFEPLEWPPQVVPQEEPKTEPAPPVEAPEPEPVPAGS